MLRVKIEVVPFGIESLTKEIFSGKIWNDETGTEKMSNYKYKCEYGEGSLKNFDRNRGALSLLKEILNKHEEI